MLDLETLTMNTPAMVPRVRIRALNDRTARSDGKYVLYWMIANRRLEWNFALDHAIAWAQELKKPLLILEALRCDYRWASDRLHRFVIEGMAEHQAALHGHPNVRYFPYLEPSPGAGRGLLRELTAEASMVVTDDFPCFFLPRMIQAAAKRAPVRFEAVDSNGLLPMHATDRIFTRAFSLRRFLQKELLPHLHNQPAESPLTTAALRSLPKAPAMPRAITQRWPEATKSMLGSPEVTCGELPINHDVTPAPMQGGAIEAHGLLANFLTNKLEKYGQLRNQPEEDVASGLSPYLHFGHISAHQIWHELTAREQWDAGCVAEKVTGSSDGWWGMSEAAEGFVDQLTTWRELGYNFCSHVQDFDSYESLPDWAIETMEQHASDERPHTYSLEQFERSQTHDPLWNAAQRQLVQEGAIHNYLRMLWGKKILHWTAHPRDALDIMIELNNKYAVDGRNPNSYSGICWVMGRFDRAWGPERDIFGKIRYMTSDNTARKVRVKSYIKKYGAADPQARLF